MSERSTRRTSVVTKSAALAAVIVTMGAVLVAAPAATAAPKTSVAESAETSTSHGTDPANARSAGTADSGIDPLGYWTPERMAAATPADEVGSATNAATTESSRKLASTPAPTPTNASDPVAATVASPQARASVPVPTTVGKLYFKEPNGGDYVCSGATVNSAAKNLIHTAAHCVYTYGKGWNKNIAFVPAYFNGQRPYGLWNYRLARTFNVWMNSQDYTHDQAFVSFYPVSGVQLVNQVGGNGLSINNGPRMSGVRIWGYPAEAPYTGQLPYYCDGDTQLYGLVTQTQMSGCSLTGGASGGPWLSSRINVNLGYVYAVTSRRTLSGTPSLISTPNGEDVLTMFNQMG